MTAQTATLAPSQSVAGVNAVTGLPERAELVRDITANLIANEVRAAAETDDRTDLDAAEDEAILGAFEAFLQALRATGGRRAKLTRLYAHSLKRELQQVDGPAA